jgi:hypothetical protein
MSHEHFQIAKASPEALNVIVIGGGIGALVLISLVLFLIWRDKRRGLGKPKAGPEARARKHRKRR